MRNPSRTTIKRIKRNYPSDWAWALKVAKGNIQKAAVIAVDEIFFPVDFWNLRHKRVQITPYATATVSKNCPPEILVAAKKMAEIAYENSDQLTKK